MAGYRSSRQGNSSGRRLLGRGVMVMFAAAAIMAAFALPTNAEEPEPNFAFSGMNPVAGTPLAISEVVTANRFTFCKNANGLGSEAYLEATAPSGLYIEHATVSPMVVPVHLGVIEVDNPDPDSPVSGELITFGVVEGTPVEFGGSGPANAKYGGIAWSDEATGVLSWDYTGDVVCDQSLAMPIIEPLVPTTTTTP